MHTLIVKLIISPAGLGTPSKIHLRLLSAAVYGLRFTTQDSERLDVLAATTRMFLANIETPKRQQEENDSSAAEKEKLLQEASLTLKKGCEIIAAASNAKQNMRERFVENRRREDEILLADRKQHASALDAELASATQSLLEQEDTLLQLHLNRLISLVSSTHGEAGPDAERLLKAIRAYGLECRARFTQACRSATGSLQKEMGMLFMDEKHLVVPAFMMLIFCISCFSSSCNFLNRRGGAWAYPHSFERSKEATRCAYRCSIGPKNLLRGRTVGGNSSR